MAVVALYSSLIVLAALVGGLIPVVGLGRTRSEWLAFAAGLMMGAAFFHMLPEAFEQGGYLAFTLVPVGFLFLFVLERFVLTHVCEEPDDCAEHTGENAALGWTAFLGLSAHTIFDGVALGSAVLSGAGLTAFVAITAHKIPSSVSLASILKSERLPTSRILARVALLGAMVPLGAFAYLGLNSLVNLENLSPKALAFSVGTFLYVAVADLLPTATRHAHKGRLKHVGLLILGLGLTWGLARLIRHPH